MKGILQDVHSWNLRKDKRQRKGKEGSWTRNARSGKGVIERSLERLIGLQARPRGRDAQTKGRGSHQMGGGARFKKGRRLLVKTSLESQEEGRVQGAQQTRGGELGIGVTRRQSKGLGKTVAKKFQVRGKPDPKNNENQVEASTRKERVESKC